MPPFLHAGKYASHFFQDSSVPVLHTIYCWKQVRTTSCLRHAVVPLPFFLSGIYVDSRSMITVCKITRIFRIKFKILLVDLSVYNGVLRIDITLAVSVWRLHGTLATKIRSYGLLERYWPIPIEYMRISRTHKHSIPLDMFFTKHVVLRRRLVGLTA